VGIAASRDLRVAGFRRVRLRCRPLLALPALLALAASCLASEPSAALLRAGTPDVPIQGSASILRYRGHNFVVVEPEGTAPKGFRYRIVLDSTARGAASSLDVTAEEGGLLVIARDVDGVGNDLDLIIKSASSLAPAGVWINDHRGGFTKADSSIYAPSIWSEGSLIRSQNPTNHLQPAVAPSYQPCIHPLAQCYRFALWLGEDLVKSSSFALPSRLTVGSHQTRGPPSPLRVER